MQETNNKLPSNNSIFKSTRETFQAAHKALSKSHATLQSKHKKLQVDHKALRVLLVNKQRTSADKGDVEFPSSENRDKKPMATKTNDDALQSCIQQIKTELQEKVVENFEILETFKETKKELRQEEEALRDIKHKLDEEQVTAMEYLKAANIIESKRRDNTILMLEKEHATLHVEVVALRTERGALRNECGHENPMEIIQKLKVQVQQLESKLENSQSDARALMYTDKV